MLQALSDCILLRLVVNIGTRQSLVLKNANKELSIRMKPLIHEDAVRRMKRFWKWCRLFSSNEMLAKSFMRTGLFTKSVMSFRLD